MKVYNLSDQSFETDFNIHLIAVLNHFILFHFILFYFISFHLNLN